MTQEEKQLLLRDLSARLPYEPWVWFQENWNTNPNFKGNVSLLRTYHLDYIIEDKDITLMPYLRPMSSMTEEEFNELHKLCPHSVFNATNVLGWIVGINGSDYGRIARVNEMSNFINWLNKNMFDYKGLIPMGLALKAPEGMYRKEAEK